MTESPIPTIPNCQDVTVTLAPAPMRVLLGSPEESLFRNVLRFSELVIDEEARSTEEIVSSAEHHQMTEQRREVYIQYWRGVFLDRFFCVERNIGIVISRHFGIEESRLDDWNRWFIGKITFEGKQQTLRGVLEAQGLSARFPSLGVHLSAVQSFRNVIVHGAIADVSESGDVSVMHLAGGEFRTTAFRDLDFYLNTWRLHALNVDIVRLNAIVAGLEEDLEPTPLEWIRQLEAARRSDCSSCGSGKAYAIYALPDDPWLSADIAGNPLSTCCMDEQCELYMNIPDEFYIE